MAAKDTSESIKPEKKRALAVLMHYLVNVYEGEMRRLGISEFEKLIPKPDGVQDELALDGKQKRKKPKRYAPDLMRKKGTTGFHEVLPLVKEACQERVRKKGFDRYMYGPFEVLFGETLTGLKSAHVSPFSNVSDHIKMSDEEINDLVNYYCGTYTIFRYARQTKRGRRSNEKDIRYIVNSRMTVEAPLPGEKAMTFEYKFYSEKTPTTNPHIFVGHVLPIEGLLYFIGIDTAHDHPVLFAVKKHKEELDQLNGLVIRKHFDKELFAARICLIKHTDKNQKEMSMVPHKFDERRLTEKLVEYLPAPISQAQTRNELPIIDIGLNTEYILNNTSEDGKIPLLMY